MKTRKILSAMLLMIGGSGLFGCAGSVPTETNPCPCASGYVCCSSGVCATDQGGCGAVTAVLSQAVAGDWTGYVEDFSFPSGSDAIKISIAVAPDGTLSGQVVLGAGSAPPPATDPDVAWPEGVSATSVRYGLEGASYDALNILWEANRLKFSISLYSPWAPWCALQTPYPSANLGYSCVAATGLYDGQGQPIMDAAGNCELDTTPPTAVDCGKVFPLCVGTPPICACDASGCAPTQISGISFDLALQDGVGNGSTNLPFFGGTTTTNVRLTQVK